MKYFLSLLLFVASQLVSAQSLTGNPDLTDDETYGYLFCHKSAHGGWTAYALSPDGIHFHDLLCGDSVFPDGVADAVRGGAPFLCRAYDGGFLMAARSGDSRIDIFRSDDLLDWTLVTSLNMPKDNRVGDPGTR